MAAVPAGGVFDPLIYVVGFAVGRAIGPVLRPFLQDETNYVWSQHRVLPFGGQTAAELVAAGVWPLDRAYTEASYTGVSDNRLDALLAHARRYPDTAELLELWRRGRLTEGEVGLALERAGIPDNYRAAVLDLFTGRLDPAVIATAIQRGIMRDPGFLPVGPPSAVGKVQAFPVSPLDPLAEAKAQSIDEARLFIETALVGLPASNEQAANAYFRGIIDRADYDRAISEGNTRNEWRDAILEQSRQILTANQYAELQLRGFLTEAQRRALTALHGMSPADSDRLYNVLGRSINVHQIVTGEARGGVYPGNYANVPQPYRAAIQRSNIREEYSELAYANRYTYPSFFAIRALLQANVLTADEGYQILLEMGWKPSLARLVADHYGQAVTAAAGPRVKQAQTVAVTEIRNAYVLGQADATQARDWLTTVGVDAAEVDGMIPIWDVLREVPQRGLTAAQIKKAYANLPAAWPRGRAIGALEALGLTADDAATILDE